MPIRSELLLFGLLLLGLHATGQADDFQAKSVTNTGRLRFPAAVDRVFLMFTPIGEKAWAEGWNPHIVYPRDGEIAEGMVFTTEDHGGAFWVNTQYDPAQHAVSYANFAPGVLINRIQIRCRALGANETEVAVTYTHTGLSEHGNQFVEHMDAAAFAKKMQYWQEAIGRALGGTPK